jgi:hypothetical protein
MGRLIAAVFRRLLTTQPGGDPSAVCRDFRFFGTEPEDLADQPEQAAVRSISEFASLLGVNPSTLTRPAKRLGYGGFSDFQGIFREAIANAISTVAKSADC